MSYQTYTTDAIVCGVRNNKTSDRSYLLFTHDAGMLWAAARSVREERSRQRYALQPYSLIRVSLIKGKSGWRIGSVETHGNAFLQAVDRSTRHTVTKCFLLVRRFLHGDDAIKNIFIDLQTLCKEALQMKSLSTISADLFALRMLTTLGYVAPTSVHTSLTANPDWYQLQDPLDTSIKKELELAIAQSHL